MTEPIIEVKNLNKTYKLYKNNFQRMRALLFRRKVNCKKKRANNNISFKIMPGESVAIIGKNGGGKSTLVKMISGVSFPTSGEIIVNGKVNAMLDLNAGFDPEFTGRQNLRMRAQILGISLQDFLEKEEEIIAFTELGEYIDQPLRTYPSGMAGRLGFAVNTMIEHDILIIDEALNVGGRLFRGKCIRILQDMIKKDKKTFIFVSNATTLNKKLCDRGLVIDSGKLVFDGDIADAEQFLEDNYMHPQKKANDGKTGKKPGKNAGKKPAEKPASKAAKQGKPAGKPGTSKPNNTPQ